ncbi:SURF1 family protein [Nocardioides sp. Kera G14]|uniref:SURF1 family protein n=1 Tax=Nocardioides sp. Kera G14 TaxID=2884264 RepID=UPI001D11A0E9|nr:SURF1 family protein [Nocardioides sp. Kera G14]UDY23600.1 SURF1 family protein [Nocardioides sp. Kera G14]
MPVPWWSRRMWGAHLLGLILLVAAILLGYWQLSVWHDHREAAKVDLTHETPKPLDDVMGSDDPFPSDGVGRPVTISGTWLPSGTVYVSGRTHDGHSGYWVVTPIAVGSTPTAPAIPVVRGWTREIPDPTSGNPGFGEVAGAVTLTAWLQPGEGELVSDDDPDDDVIPQMRIADLIQHVDQDLYGGYAIDQKPTAGLEPADLAQLPSSGAGEGLRNFLYALEWWFFGGFAIFVWWKYVMELRHPEPEPEDEGDPENLPQEPEVASTP